MTWQIFTGDPEAAKGPDAWKALPQPPPWRTRSTAIKNFVITDDLRDAVNTALHLRRPLLLTGAPGSGKSTLVSVIAAELQLGEPLNWHVTSRSALTDALYQYDALGRLHATQTEGGSVSSRVDQFVTLGPLGTALAATDRPRAVLIDEIDKSDLDLPGDLLNVLEQGEFDIPPLVRDARSATSTTSSKELIHHIRGADRDIYEVVNGRVARTHWPVIVLTSNGERSFPAPFLRRCVRFTMPPPPRTFIIDVIESYFGTGVDVELKQIKDFAARVEAGESLALDQLLNYIHLLTGESATEVTDRKVIADILLQDLSGK